MALAAANAHDPVARRLFGQQAYSSLSADEQALISNAATQAFTVIVEFAKWYNRTGTESSDSPDAWVPWLTAETVLRVAPYTHPELVNDLQQELERERNAALSLYQRKAVAYDPSSDTEAFDYHTTALRHYVIGTCVKLDRPLFPSVESVDTAIYHVLTRLWNQADWLVRRRQVRIRVSTISITGGNWDQSALQINSVDASDFTFNASTPAVFHVTSGTNVVKGDFMISASTATAITLRSDISTTGGDLSNTDIAGKIVQVQIVGLDQSLATDETFDSFVTFGLHYVGETTSGSLTWANADRFSERRSRDGDDTGRPDVFRIIRRQAAHVWMFSPDPDAAYELAGEALVATPANPTSATDTSPFDAFFAESMPLVRRMVLDEVLTNYGRENRALARRVHEEHRESMAHYQDPGRVDDVQGVRDVNRDECFMFGDDNMIGGAM